MNIRVSVQNTQAIQHLILGLSVSILALVGCTPKAQGETIAKAERGITGIYTFQYAGLTLRAKVQRETN